MKKALSLLLAVMMLLSLVACGGNNTTTDSSNSTTSGAPTAPTPGTSTPSTSTTPTAPVEGVTYKERAVIGYSDALKSKDPHASGRATDYFAYRAVHGTLLDYSTETGEYIPDLAENWTISSDGLTYTFYLRKGVTFHNGEPFTAKDVKFSFERMADSALTQSGVSAVSEVKIVDDYTVDVILKTPNSEFLVGIGIANMCILNEKAVTEDEINGPGIGTGAYVWTELAPDDYALFTRNENYWGELPPTKEIVFKKYAEAGARSIALQTGEIDVDMNLVAVDAHHIAEDPNTRLVEVPTLKLVYVAFNCGGTYPEIADVRVRQALNYATNVEDIILVMTEGRGIVPNGVMPVGVWGYDKNVDAYEYDVEKAKALLAEAGYGPNNPLEIQLCATGDKTPIFDILQAQWAQAGVNLTLQTSDSTVLSDLRSSDTYWMFIHQYNWTGTSTPLNILYHADSSSNVPEYRNRELSDLIDQSIAETDDNKRLELFAQISQKLVDGAPIVPLYQDVLLIGERNNVSGMYYGPTTNHDFTYIAVAEE